MIQKFCMILHENTLLKTSTLQMKTTAEKIKLTR